MTNKKGYFQGGGGVNEPAPKKKKYKSDKAIVMQPRFKEPLYHNNDLYDVPGVDGKAKHGPGAGFYQNMDEYKSVSDFINQKRNSHKYEADDSWIEDDGSISKKARMDRRLGLLYLIIKNAIDFPVDDQIGSGSIMGGSGTVSDSVPIGGMTDEYTPENDFEGKSPDQLDFGRDYSDDEDADKDLDKLEQKYLTPKEPSLYGLPDGISPQEDLDPESTLSEVSQQYGTTNSGNTLYDNI